MLEWQEHTEDFKMGTKTKQFDACYESKHWNLKNKDKKISILVEKKIRRSKQNSKSNREINKPLDLTVTSKNHDKSETKRLKRMKLPTPDTETALKRLKVVELTESVSDTAEQPNQASVCLSENQPSLTREDFPIQNSCLPEVSVEESDDRSCVEEIEQVENRKLKRPSVIQNYSNLTNSLSNPKQPSQASDCLSENQPSPTREDFPFQNSCLPELSVEESDDRSCVEEIEHVENREQERPSGIQNYSNLTNSLSNPKPHIQPTFFTDLLTVLRNLHTVSANSFTLIKNLRQVIIDNTKALKDVKQLCVNSCSSNSDIRASSPSTNTTVEVQKISEKNKSSRKPRDEESDDHSEDDTDKVPKKRSSKKRRFVLPPEYDENDSRWTLKYREAASGLVELMPHTNVFVNSIGLSKCKRLSKDCKSLARMLLVEIFTKSALTICSLTGSRARAYVVEGGTVRPGLDENARTVLFAYVEEYRREKGWITEDASSIQNSIRNKMQEFRSKYGYRIASFL